jgi:hypothetical protein
MIVGGREFDETPEGIERKMSNVEPESIREYHVIVSGRAYPPKQVLATVTGWPRMSFTTMEAQRVLAKLGFPSRQGKVRTQPAASMTEATQGVGGRRLESRMSSLESALAVANEAIASLTRRVARLEDRS